MNFDLINIKELIPQQPPFVFVDGLEYCDTKCCTTYFKIKDNSIFLINGKLSAPGLVENIAQTCAAMIGYCNKHMGDGAIKLGFIGGIKNLEIFELPLSGDKITTKVETVADVGVAKIVNATTMLNGKTIASGEMKIFEQE